MPPRKRIKVAEDGARDKAVTKAEINRCLEMDREIVGRVEALEADNGLTVYFLISTRSNVKQSLWYVQTIKSYACIES